MLAANGQLSSSGQKITSRLVVQIISDNMNQSSTDGSKATIITGVVIETKVMFGITTNQIKATFIQQ